MKIDLAVLIASALVLFIIGLYGLITKRDALRIIISIEILVIASNLVFIGVSYLNTNINSIGQTYVLLSMGIGGAIIGLALSFLAKIYEKNKTVDLDKLRELRW